MKPNRDENGMNYNCLQYLTESGVESAMDG